MKAFFIFLFCFTINFSSAVVLEQTKAQVGDKMISLIDVKTFQKRENLDLIPDSLLLDSLYKNPELIKQEKALFIISNLSKNKPKTAVSSSNRQPLSKQDLALNYLIVREIVLQKQKTSEAKRNQPEAQISENNIKKILKKKKGQSSSTQFLSKLKKAGFNSLLYQIFLKEEEKIRLFLLRSLTPRAVLSNREIESAFFKVYKRRLFSEYEYDFLFVSFEEDKKELVLQSLLKKNHLKDFKAWAESLGLSFKNSKLKSKEIGPSIKKELDKLSVSQTSPLLFINSSYYLLKLNWKEALIEAKDRDKRLQVEQKLFQNKLLKELSYWIQNEKDQIFVKLSSL